MRLAVHHNAQGNEHRKDYCHRQNKQLTLSGRNERRTLPYHKALLNGELPYCIGGGIGQSRLCMLLLGCAHIGEVQCGVWDQETQADCKAAGINLL